VIAGPEGEMAPLYSASASLGPSFTGGGSGRC